MKKVILALVSVCALFVLSASAYNCSTCHKGELTGADKSIAHAQQLKGLDAMTNMMHMGLKNCTACHSKENLATATSASASLLGGSREALGSAPACMGCHNPANIPGPHWSVWDWDRIKLHTFSIPK